MELSEEQCKYVENPSIEDSKLVAVAGSGKSTSAIMRISFMIKSLKVSASSIFMLTFARNAREDFVRRLEKLECPMPIKNVYTIDALAFYILASDNTQTDVSILSYSLMKILQNESSKCIVHKYPLLAQIQHVFLDEAQDLNASQYEIISLLKSKLDVKLHLIGDQNQNIYQFRGGSDKYLRDFITNNVFYLSTNYRSRQKIVEFSSYLRPYAEIEKVKHVKEKGSVTFFAHKDYKAFENDFITLIKGIQARNIPLHKVAILAPSRGYISDTSEKPSFKGLCYIANLLYSQKIKFKQFYNDASAEDDVKACKKLKYKPEKNSINLMTYTGSKGLEWDYVLLLDANGFLISSREYSPEKFKAEQYLVYVAASRACKQLFIFSRA